MEEVRPWCGEPWDRGRLKNRNRTVTDRRTVLTTRSGAAAAAAAAAAADMNLPFVTESAEPRLRPSATAARRRVYGECVTFSHLPCICGSP